MPPEIAVLALPRKESEAPTVILNTAEKNQRAAYSVFRIDAVAAAAVAWIAERLARWARDHPAAAATFTAAATSAAVATGANIALDDGRAPAALPQQTITIVATRMEPVVATTRTPARTTVTTTPSPKAVTATDPTQPPVLRTAEAEPSVEPTTKPTVRSTTKLTRKSSAKPTASSEATTPTAQEVPAIRTPPAPSPSPGQPAATPPPAAEEEPASTTAAARGCAVRVDLDPLLDLCVLS
ncbi:hypothetical protein [Nonomuraea sp. NPDC049028]|uniref:hypothetical protein n=1 Tax=Nonomuraea sp. NPDC049028 TaxID=3364348 RepID=UPI00372360C0